MNMRNWIVIVLAIAATAGGYAYWQQQIASQLPEGIISSNGRIEAIQINISTKQAGRIAEISVDEGEMVDAGQIVARMDTAELNAQKRQAEAEVRRAERIKIEASAFVLQSKSQLAFAEIELKRVQSLQKKGYATTEKLDERRNEMQAAYASYRASVSGVDQADEAIISAQQALERLKTILAETELKAPRRGRIQYRLAQPGEVLAAGGSVLTLLDLSDVYMTIFLPASDAGKLAIGDEARLVLDPIPENVIPAKISFVASEAQFTPKAVETSDERAKLMFRVKLKIAPDLLKKNESRVKTGIRGTAFLRLPSTKVWPENLEVNLPE